MKRILFVLRSASSGGATTSMLNLLSLLKQQGYAVDLFLFQKNGCFQERAESVANVLPEEKVISSIMYTKKDLKKCGVEAWVIRILFVICHNIFGADKAWQWFYRISARKLAGLYDTVVAYQESQVTEYVQYIQCKRKVAWIHNDYCRFVEKKTKLQMQQIYDHYNDVICVSNASRESMLNNLNLSEKHVHMIYNTIPQRDIVEKSKEFVDVLERRKYTFISMGRFAKQKGFDRAVNVAFKLKSEGIDFVWYIIGSGDEMELIKKMIEEKGLLNELVLLGLKINPFPYIKQADCFIMTSRYEAQPMVLNEALTLGIPVISTNFSSAKEVVKNGINGFIVENNENGIYEGINRFITQPKEREVIEKGAKDFYYGNKEIVDSIINLL